MERLGKIQFVLSALYPVELAMVSHMRPLTSVSELSMALWVSWLQALQAFIFIFIV